MKNIIPGFFYIFDTPFGLLKIEELNHEIIKISSIILLQIELLNLRAL